MQEREKYTPSRFFPGYPSRYPFIYGSETNKSFFVNCFIRVSDKMSEKENDYFDKNNFSQNTLISPCMEPKKYPECIDYCNWHKNYFKAWPKEDFMTIMKFGMPQRKLFLETILPNEKKMAEKLFGSENTKNLNGMILMMTT